MCTPSIVEGSAGDPPKSRLPAASLPGPIDPPTLACSPYLSMVSYLSPHLSLVSPHRAVSRPGEPTPVPTPVALAKR